MEKSKDFYTTLWTDYIGERYVHEGEIFCDFFICDATGRIVVLFLLPTTARIKGGGLESISGQLEFTARDVQDLSSKSIGTAPPMTSFRSEIEHEPRDQRLR